jgi:hypothetical protein
MFEFIFTIFDRYWHWKGQENSPRAVISRTKWLPVTRYTQLLSCSLHRTWASQNTSQQERTQALFRPVALVAFHAILSYAFEKFGMGFQNDSNRMLNKVVSITDVVMELWCKLNNEIRCVNYATLQSERTLNFFAVIMRMRSSVRVTSRRIDKRRRLL